MKRLENIDVLRGIVMVLMCFDHARDYTGIMPSDPMDLATTPYWVYVLRILAHFCAPAFIFLSGLSILLSSENKDKSDVSKKLLIRGAILCLLEVTLVNFGWSFNLFYGVIFLQIIWAIGISMIFMAGMIHLPRWAIFTVGAGIIALHNIFGGVHFGDCAPLHYGWSFILQKNMLPIGSDFAVRTTYPVLPVFAIMAIGYCAGKWFSADYDAQKRKSNLFISSGVMLALFFVFRAFVGYGDPHPIDKDNFWMSLFNVTKYPISFNFAMMTLPFTTLFLALTDGRKFSLKNPFLTLGRVPMFFYITHLYVLHLIILTYLFFSPHTINFSDSFGGVPLGAGFPAWWLIWVIPFTVAVLLFPCREYHKLKQSRRFRWTQYI